MHRSVLYKGVGEGLTAFSFCVIMNVNGINWKIKFTSSERDLTVNGTVRLGVTDRNTATIYLYDGLYGNLLRKVLIHELTHAWLFSYDYDLDVEVEELICSFVDTYAQDIVFMADDLLAENIFMRKFKKPIDLFGSMS